MKTFHRLMGYLNAPTDRIISPKFARELHAIVQFFTAFCAGFAIVTFIFLESFLGLTLCVLGIVCVLPAWLITSLGTRMALEVALVILAIHRITIRYAEPQSTDPTSRHNAIEG